MFFEDPKQVWFLDEQEVEYTNNTDGYDFCWHTGIAYQDFIICACCGGIFKIENVLALWRKYPSVKKAIYEYPDWISFDGEMAGGELPPGFEG